jgi:AraC family transcriptional regulator
MRKTSTKKEQDKRIKDVIHFILTNLNTNISLKKLSDIANYSPFHLQKIFKEIIGETPKQYIIKIKIEVASQLLLIHSEKSIQEISSDCGFSSPSAFSRAIKNNFGYTPEELRLLSPKNRLSILNKINPNSILKEADIRSNILLRNKSYEIEIVKIKPLRGISLIVAYNDVNAIQNKFKVLKLIAKTHDLWTDDSRIYGVVTPHHRNLYRLFISTEKDAIPKNVYRTEISGGTYAKLKVKGDNKETISAMHNFLNGWIPESGYKVSDVTAFEKFSLDPSTNPYDRIEREVHIPIDLLN